MPAHIILSNRPFCAFFEDNTILIQFIMQEFIQCHLMMNKIAGYLQNQASAPSFTANCDFSCLTDLLKMLIGPSSGREHSSFPYAAKGPLTKLKDYALQFSINSLHNYKHHIDLHSASHKAWVAAIHNLELLNSEKIYKPNGNDSSLLRSRKIALTRLILCLNRVTSSIPKIMKAFSEDENVVLCLLRKKDDFEEIYGSDFLHKRFKWPKESSKLINLLILRYRLRGFETLLPSLIDLRNS